MHIKGNHKQNEKTVLRMQENIWKWSSGQSINLQNIQTVHVLQYMKKKPTQSKNGQKFKIDMSPRKIHKWPRSTWKNAQHHYLLKNCKSKLQWGITSHRSEWLPSKNLQIINAREGVQKKGALLHCWWEYKSIQPIQRTLWRFLKKLKIELPYDPAIPLLGAYPEKT